MLLETNNNASLHCFDLGCGNLLSKSIHQKNLKNLFNHEEMAWEILSAPLRVKKVMSSNIGLLHSKEMAREHGFNEAIGKFIRVRGAEIVFETCPILTVWFG
jgi:hypothetical protein